MHSFCVPVHGELGIDQLPKGGVEILGCRPAVVEDPIITTPFGAELTASLLEGIDLVYGFQHAPCKGTGTFSPHRVCCGTASDQ